MALPAGGAVDLLINTTVFIMYFLEQKVSVIIPVTPWLICTF